MSEKPDVTMGEMTKTNEKSGRKVPKKIIWTIGAVAVAAIILIIGICNGAFLSRRNKILLATRNTLKDMPQVVQNMTAADIIASGKYTIGVKSDINAVRISSSLQAWMRSSLAHPFRCLQTICWYTITEKRKTAT